MQYIDYIMNFKKKKYKYRNYCSIIISFSVYMQNHVFFYVYDRSQHFVYSSIII